MNAMAALLTSVLLVATQPAQQSPTPAGTGTKLARKFVVALIEDVQVPAREPGVLVVLDAKKGDFVQKDAVLGHVDDSDAQVRKLIADAELKSAQAQAASDASVKAADATIGVAKAEWEGDRKIKDRIENAVSEYGLRRSELTYERSIYQAETARVEYAVAQHTRAKAEAQLQAVENEITRRTIRSPVDGVVVDKFHQVGEWVQAGEPVYRVVQMDRLRVEGMLNSNEYAPEDVLGIPVRITVTTARGGKEAFEATIDFASQVVDPSGEFLIHAEFDNPRKPNGQWRVLPGLEAEVEILPARHASASPATPGRQQPPRQTLHDTSNTLK